MPPLPHPVAVHSALALLVVSGCDLQQPASRAEMRDAVAEVALLGDGIGTQTQLVELTTSFTLGQGAQAIAEEVRSFVHSQIDCSQVSVEPGRISIDFGDLSDNCTYRGRTYAGVVTVEFEDRGETFGVTHTYEGVTGGKTTLDGTVEVEWDGNVRNVVTDLDFAGERGEVSVQADRTQTFTACADAKAVCLTVQGDRDWTGPRGSWEMDILDVKMRSIDPVPESGTYAILTPDDKTIELSFERVDSDTIEVSVEGGRRPFVFNVTAAGQVSDG